MNAVKSKGLRDSRKVHLRVFHGIEECETDNEQLKETLRTVQQKWQYGGLLIDDQYKNDSVRKVSDEVNSSIISHPKVKLLFGL